MASHGYSVEFFSNIAVTKILAGMKLTDVAGGKTPDQKKPFPLEMTRFLIEVLLKADTMNNRMIRVAALMAYFLLLRQSEYIYSAGDNDHALRAQHIEFKLRAGSRFITADKVATVIYSEVEAVRVTLPHCKNDPFHRGNQFWYEVGSVQKGKYDIVFEMFQWAKVAGFRADDVFTSFRDTSNKVIRLTYYSISQKIKETALAFDLEPAEFGTHSWRIAGATTMEAAKASMSDIQRQGRWKSMSMPMHYSKSSRNEFNHALRLLANEELFTVKDLLYHSKSKS
jgi:hypothetical protein